MVGGKVRLSSVKPGRFLGHTAAAGGWRPVIHLLCEPRRVPVFSLDAPERGRRMSQRLALLSRCRKATSSPTLGRVIAAGKSGPGARSFPLTAILPLLARRHAQTPIGREKQDGSALRVQIPQAKSSR
jgi:hypothetical protein